MKSLIASNTFKELKTVLAMKEFILMYNYYCVMSCCLIRPRGEWVGRALKFVSQSLGKISSGIYFQYINIFYGKLDMLIFFEYFLDLFFWKIGVLSLIGLNCKKCIYPLYMMNEWIRIKTLPAWYLWNLVDSKSGK